MTGAVRPCVLDTDVVIGALDRADAHHAAATTLLLGLIADGAPRRMSPVSYAEALVRPAERDDGALERAVTALESLGVEVVPPTARVARDAARIRSHGVSLADAFAIAAARQVDGVVASFDRRVHRAARASGVGVVPAPSPDET